MHVLCGFGCGSGCGSCVVLCSIGEHALTRACTWGRLSVVARKVGQGDKALLDMESHVKFNPQMLEEVMAESFLECAYMPYFADVHKVQWSASDDVSVIFQHDDEYETESSNYSSMPPFDGTSSSVSPSPPCEDKSDMMHMTPVKPARSPAHLSVSSTRLDD